MIWDIFKKKTQKRNDDENLFISSILLDETHCDINLITQQLSLDWGIEISPEDIDENKTTIINEAYDAKIIISFIPSAVILNQAVKDAENNSAWNNATKTAKAHKAHILVIVSHTNDKLNAAVLHVKVCSSCLHLPNATAINTISNVLDPEHYIKCSEVIHDGIFPLLNLVYYEIYSRDEGATICGCTLGMKGLGKKEIEIIDTTCPPSDVMDYIIGVSNHIIVSNIILKDGDTISLSAEDVIDIKISNGIFLLEKTIKILMTK